MTAHPSTTFLLFHPAGPCSHVSRCPPAPLLPPSLVRLRSSTFASPNAVCPRRRAQRAFRCSGGGDVNYGIDTGP